MKTRFNVKITYRPGKRTKLVDVWEGEKVRGWGFNNQETMLYLNLGGESDEKTNREHIVWIPREDIQEFEVELVQQFETKKERLDFIKNKQNQWKPSLPITPKKKI